ncbi:MAG TPA: xanthine dehydrogenase family protein molybdopterin-binding subunit [Candidatus Caldiarchaeum subterraneum]|uniref:Xanthine dehydrogenase family protein molybdopterin-binding subunit n=1 Tax=Caldiarchaeum subterraneum TaxID=311458 RepID=A0A832ZWC3_CALS0|nr:xanthine dehydrogenase family protein molybdopterin-binding subunit [Candidatus Caldarchaeum subterraneum]
MYSRLVKFCKGRGTYLDDIRMDRMLYLGFVRSPYAHAKVNQIKIPEHVVNNRHVKLVITGRELNLRLPSIWVVEGMKPANHPLLALDKVRYVGEPVVALVCDDRYRLVDLLEEIEIDYTPLEAVVDPEKALDDNAPILHEEFGTNVGLRRVVSGGDVEKAFQEADLITRERFRFGRAAPVSIEPRGVIAYYDKYEDWLTLWSSTQMPYLLRYVAADMLKLPESRVRVIVPDVGGGFGGKHNIYPEEIIACYASLKLGRPVKWVEERRENLAATLHDRDQVQYVEMAFSRDGEIKGMKARVCFNAGAYYKFHGPRPLMLASQVITGPYRIRNIHVELLSIFTNTMPTFPYRGPVMTEITYMLDRCIDEGAYKLGMDPVEVRRKNLIKQDEFPYTTPSGSVYDSGAYLEGLEKASKIISRYVGGEKPGERVGVGFACFVEVTGLGATSKLSSLGILQGGWEYASIRIDRSGTVTVLTGVQELGQGTTDTIAKLVAEELKIPPKRVKIIYGDTALAQYGGGAFGSRSLILGGSAAVEAAKKIKDRIIKIASAILEARAEDIIYENADRIYVKDNPEKCISLKTIAEATHLARVNLDGLKPGFEETSVFDPPGIAFSYGCIAALVSVDIETGAIKVKHLVFVHDCGRVVDFKNVEQQAIGALCQGMGQAVLEEIRYDEDGNLVTSTLMDYLIPSAAEAPKYSIDHVESRTDVNPLGAKGVGETGVIGAPAAIANAVANALKEYGVKIDTIPIKPEHLLTQIKERRAEDEYR